MLKWGLYPIAALFIILVAVDFFLPLGLSGFGFSYSYEWGFSRQGILFLLEFSPVWGEDEVDATDISLENLKFSYDSNRDILKNISMKFLIRECFPLSGESGSGKSTIVNMIIGALRPGGGSC